MAEEWKRCSSCKKSIAFEATYYVCSVSTCTRKRTGFVFCAVECWDQHLPMMRHREAWAVEEKAPTKAQWLSEKGEEAGQSKRKVVPERSAPARSEAPVRRRITVGSSEPQAPPGPREVLVIASRLKTYIRERYGMNTSDGVLDALSDQLRRLADRAVQHARDDGRKTVLDRDFEFLRRP